MREGGWVLSWSEECLIRCGSLACEHSGGSDPALVCLGCSIGSSARDPELRFRVRVQPIWLGAGGFALHHGLLFYLLPPQKQGRARERDVGVGGDMVIFE